MGKMITNEMLDQIHGGIAAIRETITCLSACITEHPADESTTMAEETELHMKAIKRLHSAQTCLSRAERMIARDMDDIDNELERAIMGTLILYIMGAEMEISRARRLAIRQEDRYNKKEKEEE